MDLSSFAFVDIETTGISNRIDRIIELAILKVENGRLKQTFKTLVNPGISIPPFIENLTGISQKDLEKAPEFSEIKEELIEILKGSIFAAHNARFDYNFIKEELKRHGIIFSAKQLCTVKLFRALNPGLSHYNLDSLMATYNLSVKHRHRAYDDAKAIFEFFKKAKKIHPQEAFNESLKKVLRHITTPIHLSQEELEKLPESPGVYVFWGDDQKVPLYVGKSINIKDRIFSHFAETGSSVKELRISQQVKQIETIETAGELSALLLESDFVKKYQPLYNRHLRKLEKLVLAKQIKDKKGYLTISFEIANKISPKTLSSIVGVFRSEKQAKETIMSLAKEKELCPKLLGLEKTNHSCFWRQLGWCKGACAGKESPIFYNVRFIEAFFKYRFKSWPFAGPVVIHEKGNRHFRRLVIDNWCLLDEDQKETANFDLDTYKILSRFFSQDKNLKKVHVL